MDSKTDTPLFLRFREQGDAAALETVVRRYLNDMYTVALRVLNNATDAEDSVQDAIIRIMRAADKFDPAYPLKPWLLQKTADAARDWRRKRRSDFRKERQKSLDSEQEVTEDPLANLQREDLEAALADLDEELQLPIILYYFNKMTQAEIGEVVGCSHQTVQKRLTKAMEKLRFKLGAMGLAVTAGAMTALLGQSQVSAAPVTLSTAVTSTIAANMGGAAIAATAATASAASAGAAVAGAASAKGVFATIAASLLCLAVGSQIPAIVGKLDTDDAQERIQALELQNAQLQAANERLNESAEDAFRRFAPETAEEVKRLQQELGEREALAAALQNELDRTRREYSGFKLGAKMLAGAVGDNEAEPPAPRGDYTDLEAAIRRDIHDRAAIARYRAALNDNRDFGHGVRFFDSVLEEHPSEAILRAELGGLKVAQFGDWSNMNKTMGRTDVPAEEKLRMGVTVFEGLLTLNEALDADPDNRWALLIRARFAHHLGQPDVALQDLLHLDELYTTAPQDEDDPRRVLMLLVTCYGDRRDMSKAAEYWNRGAERFHNDDEFFALRDKYNHFRE